MNAQSWDWHGRFLKFQNKFWELQVAWFPKDWCDYFAVECRLNRRSDHAGFRFEITVMAFYFQFQIYDNRHWDNDKGDWQTHTNATGTEWDAW